jgi:hypothetical protein
VTNYVDQGLSPTTAFSYRVLAQNTMGVSVYSNVADAKTSPAAEPPAPWRHSDIGSVGLPGSAGVSDGLFIVKASGIDIWDVSDAFHFLYQSWTGDGTLVALVTGVGNTAGFAKAGLMFRETLAPNSRHAMQFIAWSGGLGFQSRTNTGGNTTYTAGSLMTTPYWLKLERVGNTFNGYASLDGTVWTLTGTDTIAMERTVYVGLAVTAHNNSALNTATFANVQVPLPATAPSLTIDRLANGTLQIGVLGQIGSTYRTDVSTNPPFWTPLVTNLNTSGSILTLDPRNLPQRFYRAVEVY